MNTRRGFIAESSTRSNGPTRRCVLRDADHALRLWPFEKDVEEAFRADADSSSRLSDRLWAFVGAVIVLACRPANDIILNGLMFFCLAGSGMIIVLTLNLALHRIWRSRLLLVIRIPYGLCVSALSASAFKRKVVCITSFSQYITQVYIIRSRLITPFFYTGAFHSGVISHFTFQSLHTALLLVTLNRQDCANMASFPVLHHMNSRMADLLHRMSHTPYAITRHVPSLALSHEDNFTSSFPSYRAPIVNSLCAASFERFCPLPLACDTSNQNSGAVFTPVTPAWTPEDVCVATRGALQVGVLLTTTVLLYISEVHGRMKHAANLGRPQGLTAFLSRYWLLHGVAGLAVFALCGVVAAVAQPLFSARAAASLLYDWNEVAGEACPWA